MLIQITNKCHEGCAHCMQCSHPQGKHMDMATFFLQSKKTQNKNHKNEQSRNTRSHRKVIV